MEFSQYWTILQSHSLFGKAAKLFTTTLLDLGGIKVSFSFVANLAIQSIAVLVISNLTKRIAKNRILPRFGLDLGTYEAFCSIISYKLGLDP